MFIGSRTVVLVVGLLASPLVHAGSVNASIEVGDGPAMKIVSRVSDPVRKEVTWLSGPDRACSALLDSDDWGEKVFVAIKVRCQDARGKLVVDSAPNVLLRWGGHGTIEVGRNATADQPGSQRVAVELDAISEEAAPAGQIVIRRSFFAERRRSVYRWMNTQPDSAALSCPDSVTPLGKNGALGGDVKGRFRRGEQLDVACSLTKADGSEQPVTVELSFF
jgi:hypothetical protein